jgi:hypothetical protein
MSKRNVERAVKRAMLAILPNDPPYRTGFNLPVETEKPKNDPHAPRYQYDCERCQFSWCCGPTCSCVLQKPGYKLGDPPRERQDFVDLALIAAGFSPQFRGKGAQRR